MTWEGKLIEPAYFWLSAGKTRNGREVLGEGYDYLVSVDCEHDIEAEGYTLRTTIKKNEFWTALGVGETEKITLTRDSAGYVLWVDAEGIHMSGEKFRSLFSLNSSCFTISEEQGLVVLESRGVGHGLSLIHIFPEIMGFPGKGKIIHIFKIMYGIQPVDQKGRLQCHILISAGICIFHVSYPLFIRGRGKKLFSPESL